MWKKREENGPVACTRDSITCTEIHTSRNHEVGGERSGDIAREKEKLLNIRKTEELGAWDSIQSGKKMT